MGSGTRPGEASFPIGASPSTHRTHPRQVRAIKRALAAGDAGSGTDAGVAREGVVFDDMWGGDAQRSAMASISAFKGAGGVPKA